jgi:hypothetical protein
MILSRRHLFEAAAASALLADMVKPNDAAANAAWIVGKAHASWPWSTP